MQKKKAATNGPARAAVKKSTLKDLTVSSKAGGVKGGARINTIQK